MQRLELKIPPAALVVITALLIWFSARWFPAFNIQIPFRITIAAALCLLGLCLPALGFVQFKRAKTTVNPTKPKSASSLVHTGIYRRTRNPMYLGFLIVLAGCATARANLLAFLILPAFVFYMNRFQIQPEERALTSIFGDEFKSYCANVRRWI